MLISFSVGNFLSFKEIQTLSLIADSLKEHPGNLHIPILYNREEKLLKSVAVYGHNSHGKTNLIKAFRFFHNLIFTSFSKGQFQSSIEIEPFKLNTSMIDKPTFFEVIFLVKSTRYRYNVLLTSTYIIEENLFYSEPKVRENYLYTRKGQDITISKQWNKENDNNISSLLQFARPHILLLSVLLSQEGITAVSDLGRWLANNIIVPDNYMEELSKAQKIYSDEDYTDLILKFIKSADLGFTTIFDKLDRVKESKSALDKGFLNMAFEKEIKEFQLFTNHSVFDTNKKEVAKIEFELLKNESSGSIKYFITVCLLAYSIRNSQLILIDELDARLHSLLLNMLVSCFHNPEINPINSQLIFTTHNTFLLDHKLRRDQMVIIERNDWGETTIRRAHSNEKPIKIGKSLEKEYRKGKIGGISNKIKKDLGPTLFD